MRERIDLQFGNGVLPEFPALKLGDPSVTYSRSVEERGSTLRVTFELRTEDHSIAPDAVPAYASLVESIEHDLHWTLPERAKPKEKKPWTRGELYALGGALGVVALAGLAVAVRRLRFVVRRRRYRRDARIQAGESATTAIDVADRAGAEKEMARARCACGGALGDSTTPCAWSEIADGRSSRGGRARELCGVRSRRSEVLSLQEVNASSVRPGAHGRGDDATECCQLRGRARSSR